MWPGGCWLRTSGRRSRGSRRPCGWSPRSRRGWVTVASIWPSPRRLCRSCRPTSAGRRCSSSFGQHGTQRSAARSNSPWTEPDFTIRLHWLRQRPHRLHRVLCRASLQPGGVLVVREHGGAVGGLVIGAARQQLLGLPSSASSRGGGAAQMLVPAWHPCGLCPVAARGVDKKVPSWLHFGQRIDRPGPASAPRGRENVVSEPTAYLAAQKVDRRPQRADSEPDDAAAVAAGGLSVAELMLRLIDLGRAEGKGAAVMAAASLAQKIEEGADGEAGEEAEQEGLATALAAAAVPPHRPADWARIISAPIKGKR